MKKTTALINVLALLTLLFFSACSRAENQDKSRSKNQTANTAGGADLTSASMDEVVEIYFTELEKLPGLFGKVQDADSAQSTGPAIKAVTDRLQDCVDRLESWDKQEVGLAMAAQAQRFMNLQQTMMPELARISSNPHLAPHLQNSLKIPSVR